VAYRNTSIVVVLSAVLGGYLILDCRKPEGPVRFVQFEAEFLVANRSKEGIAVRDGIPSVDEAIFGLFTGQGSVGIGVIGVEESYQVIVLGAARIRISLHHGFIFDNGQSCVGVTGQLVIIFEEIVPAEGGCGVSNVILKETESPPFVRRARAGLAPLC